MLFERSIDDLLRDSVLTLSQQTKITKVSPGSKARAILEATSRNLNHAYRTFDLNLARAFLSGAQGRYIDLIGELMGVSRAGTTTASANASARAVRFSVDTGTFGDINRVNGVPSSFTIPTNTRISSETGGQGVVYRTTIPVVLTATANEAFVSVEAINPGSSGNIGPNQLRFHNFTTYTDSSNNSLLVNNIAGLLTGSEVESDNNYRFRISQQVLVGEAANETAIRLVALVTPGVADILTIKFFKGIGTYRVLIKAVTPTVPLSLIQSVQDAINGVTAYGVLGEADRPDETGLTFEIKVKYRKTFPDDERATIEDSIRTVLTNYVNNLDIAESFVINEAVQRVMSVNDDILDIGIPGKPFDKIFIYKESRLRDREKDRLELVKNYTPQVFERVIIEPSSSTPFIITANTGSV